MNDRSALRIEDLHKSFGGLEVLRGIDLSVAEHEVVCLIGASGSGKSTLLRCINHIEPIDSGRIFVGETEVTVRSVDVCSAPHAFSYPCSARRYIASASAVLP